MAIFLGSSNFNGSNGSHFTASVYLDSYSQSVENNSTTYTLHLYVGSIDGYSAYGSAANGYLQGTWSGSTTSFPARTQRDMGTYTGTIQHNDDGTAYLNVSASVITNWSGVGSAYINTGWSVPTIPRSASITANDGTIEESTKITIKRLTTSYTYDLSYSINDDDGTAHTGTIATGINQDSYDWIIPEVFLQYYRVGTSRTCTIICKTYNGTSLIGTKTTDINIMASSNTMPTVSTWQFKDMNSKTIALTDDSSVMVQGYSAGYLALTIKLSYYSKVSSVKDENNKSVEYSIVSDTDQVQTLSIENDYSDFSITHTITILDGRGNGKVIALVPSDTTSSTSNTGALFKITYKRVNYIPLMLSMTAKRPSATTGEIEVTFSGNYFNDSFGGADNALELSWKYRIKGATDWTTGGTFTKDTDYTITGNTFESKGSVSLGKIFTYTNVYEIAIYYKDKLVDTYTSRIVTKGTPVYWWNANSFNILVPAYLKSGNEILDYDVVDEW